MRTPGILHGISPQILLLTTLIILQTTLQYSAAAEPAASRAVVDEAWNAAHVDEQWNISRWGEDEEAQRRLAARHIEFSAAAKMLALLRTK